LNISAGGGGRCWAPNAADLKVMTMDARPHGKLGSEMPPAAEMLDSMRLAAEEAANLLRSIGSPYRLMILCLLVESEKTVTEICDAIGARQSLTSQHLTRLRLDGLVKAERRGHFVYYALADTVAKEIVATLYRHYCAKAVAPKRKSAKR
jgi:DNA-binding transcriptional ArsR family regulator